MEKETLIRELDQIISYGLSHKYTSVSYAIMVDGELVANNSLGTTGGKDPKPATTDCTYNVASVSKIYTTTAVMQLVEQGKLDLDAPVITYIPAFRMLSPEYTEVTLRQCLSHSCGLPGTQWVDFSLSDQSECDYYKDALDFYAKSHLKAKPGTYSVYCNDGFTLAEMCVAAVSEEKSFSEYCRIHITDPLGAYSSRFARSYNPEYTLIAQGKGPAELVTAQGLGGLTTSMKDLALFGTQFLKDTPMLTAASKAEMAASHGRTFLKKDNSTVGYGLGWDNVNYHHPDYDLGDGAMRKGGASFQFGSQLLIVPKYNAVIALSQTYDCALDTKPLVLRLLAYALWAVKGINITRFRIIPERVRKAYAGDYLTPGTMLRVRMHGAFCFVNSLDGRGKSRTASGPYGYLGGRFVDVNGQELHFEQAEGNTFALTLWQGAMTPMAQKIRDGKALSAPWKARVGKRYVNVSVSPFDEVIGDMMAGFELQTCPDHRGILMLSFQNGEAGSEGVMDCPVKPLDSDVATGFLLTPDNPSRDLVSPIFSRVDGVEYCDAASYRFRDTSSLSVYEGQGFGPRRAEAAAYRFGYRLTKLPEVPEGRRVLVLTEKLDLVYDSLMMGGEFGGCDCGVIILA